MSTALAGTNPVAWWKEPTKDQWLAWVAAWLGWTLDAFDFTIFLLLMVPIAKDFGVPLTEVAIVFALTLWMRLIGATASGWLADRIGRKKPLMISIAWFSVCNLFAGLAPSFMLLLLFPCCSGHRHGRGMAGWCGAGHGDLAATFARLHGLRAARLVGARRVALERRIRPAVRFDRLARTAADRRASALLIVYIRIYVKEPRVWIDNRRKQRAQNREFRAPLLNIFKRKCSPTRSPRAG